MKHLKRAIALMPGLSQPHLYLSRIDMEAGRKDEAAVEAAIVRKLAAGERQTAELPESMRTLVQVRSPR